MCAVSPPARQDTELLEQSALRRSFEGRTASQAVSFKEEPSIDTQMIINVRQSLAVDTGLLKQSAASSDRQLLER